ncbi:MAG: DsbA family oxidoreductase [Paracoccaceae bacterium]
MIRLDIFSDPVCPWCFIGKANLDRALEGAAEHPFSVEWQPFQLNPDLPRGGVAKRDYLIARFGSAEKVDQIHDRLRQIARDNGVELDPDKPQRLPNTLDAHRLIHWAGIEGRQTPLVSALFRAYWQGGRDIGDARVLTEIAEAVGMDGPTVARLLASDADADDILARDADARSKGVSAVPTFLIDRRYVVQGAQPPETWSKVIAEVTEKARE